MQLLLCAANITHNFFVANIINIRSQFILAWGKWQMKIEIIPELFHQQVFSIAIFFFVHLVSATNDSVNKFLSSMNRFDRFFPFYYINFSFVVAVVQYQWCSLYYFTINSSKIFSFFIENNPIKIHAHVKHQQIYKLMITN